MSFALRTTCQEALLQVHLRVRGGESIQLGSTGIASSAQPGKDLRN